MKLPIRALLALLAAAQPVAASSLSSIHETDWLTLSVGASGVFDAEENPALIADYQFRQHYRGIHPWVMVSWATDGAVFCGAGAVVHWEFQRTWCLSVAAAPGYYERHQGVDLGGHFEIFSFAELSRRLANGHRLGFRVSHISNGAVSERNPGMEILTLSYAIPLR